MNEFVSASLIGVSLGAQYALLALGFTLIFGILGVVNFAHGELASDYRTRIRDFFLKHL